MLKIQCDGHFILFLRNDSPFKSILSTINQWVYHEKEVGANGTPVRDIDFTAQTYPNGKIKERHWAPVQQLYKENSILL